MKAAMALQGSRFHPCQALLYRNYRKPGRTSTVVIQFARCRHGYQLCLPSMPHLFASSRCGAVAAVATVSGPCSLGTCGNRLADDSVGCEPVSGSKFPANREINGEFCRTRPSAGVLGAQQASEFNGFPLKFPLQRNMESFDT
jgi:hypothetical protein